MQQLSLSGGKLAASAIACVFVAILLLAIRPLAFPFNLTGAIALLTAAYALVMRAIT